MSGSDYILTIKKHLRTAYLLSDEKIETALPRFLETVTGLIFELENLALTDKQDALSRTGHALKGALLNLGLFDLAEKAFAIEKYHQNCEDKNRCKELIDELKHEINKFL